MKNDLLVLADRTNGRAPSVCLSSQRWF